MESGSTQYTWKSGDFSKTSRKSPPYNGVEISYSPTYDPKTKQFVFLEVTVTDYTLSESGISCIIRKLTLEDGWVPIQPTNANTLSATANTEENWEDPKTIEPQEQNQEDLKTTDPQPLTDVKRDSAATQLPEDEKKKPSFCKKFSFGIKKADTPKTEAAETTPADVAVSQNDNAANLPKTEVAETAETTPADATASQNDNMTANILDEDKTKFTVKGDLKLRLSSTWILLRVSFSYGLEHLRRHELGFIGGFPTIQPVQPTPQFETN